MRLTLRTLLAHLDKTLEADDDAAIAAKLSESEFASNLVQRISACIANDQIGAPSPVSTSTADDPNRIGEYLDSVLAAEQVAEIERICLESDGHLAEVAACHQILTIVLGNPADIPAALRQRVFDLARERHSGSALLSHVNGNPNDPAPRAASPSGVIGSSDAITQAIAADMPPASQATGHSEAVLPVGPDDSGVSDAPTRLREAALAKSEVGRRESVMAGSRPINAAEASELFGRPSRVVPWLVSLALIAAFLFVAVQAFSPLLRKRAAEREGSLAQVSGDPALSPSQDQSTPEIVSEVEADVAPPVIELDPVPAPPPFAPNETTAVPPLEVQPDAVDELPAPMADAAASRPTPTLTPTPSTETVTETATAPAQDASSPANAAADSSAAEMTAAANASDQQVDLPPPITEVVPAEAMAPAIDDSQAVLADTTLTSDQSLLLVRGPSEASYALVKMGDPIANRSDLICPPLYRDRLTVLGGLDMTMAGPTQMKLESATGEAGLIEIDSGRLLLSPLVRAPASPGDEDPAVDPAAGSGEPIRIAFGGAVHELVFQESESRAALEVQFLRPPGEDPEDEQSSTSVIEVLAVRGTVLWTTQGEQPVTLNTGEIVRWSPAAESTKTIQAEVPSWIDAPTPAPGAIETSARDGLLALVGTDESVELSLREAINFRRAEVGALAGQTLVLLDRPSVYFGADGIFSDVKQKAYWPEHFQTLVAAVDRGPESAAVVREAINQMDAADATAIYRLLWLFSNAQLEAGADELLVSSLDHANMTVRVLAAENLRLITGTTLFFKPENETAPRRSSDIKKWETRLRKGDIRWPAQ